MKKIKELLRKVKGSHDVRKKIVKGREDERRLGKG